MSTKYKFGAARFSNYYAASTPTAVADLELADCEAVGIEGEMVLLLSNEAGEGLIVSGTSDEVVDYLTLALNHAIARRALTPPAPQLAEIPADLAEARDTALLARAAHRTEVA